MLFLCFSFFRKNRNCFYFIGKMFFLVKNRCKCKKFFWHDKTVRKKVTSFAGCVGAKNFSPVRAQLLITPYKRSAVRGKANILALNSEGVARLRRCATPSVSSSEVFALSPSCARGYSRETPPVFCTAKN